MKRTQVLGLLLAAVVGCPGSRRRKPPPPLPVAEPAPLVVPAGLLKDGRFFDSRFRYSIAQPAQWSVVMGREQDAMRMRMTHDDTGIALEIWVFQGTGLAPRARAGCPWYFQDVGPYKGLPGGAAIGVASCTSVQADEALAMAWMRELEDAVLQIEVQYPEGTLLRGDPMVRRVLATLRTQLPSPAADGS